MAALSESAPSPPIAPVTLLARLRGWRATRRRTSADFLAMGAATVALFVALLFGVDLLAGSGLVGRILNGGFTPRTRADYSVTTDQRVKPVRSSAVTTTVTNGQAAGSAGTADARR